MRGNYEYVRDSQLLKKNRPKNTVKQKALVNLYSDILSWVGSTTNRWPPTRRP